MPADGGDPAARIGQLLLVAAAVLLMVGLLASLPRALRVRRRLLRLRALIEASRREVEGELVDLTDRRQELEQALVPARRVQRWLTHPVTVAFLQSLSRRWARFRARPEV